MIKAINETEYRVKENLSEPYQLVTTVGARGRFGEDSDCKSFIKYKDVTITKGDIIKGIFYCDYQDHEKAGIFYDTEKSYDKYGHHDYFEFVGKFLSFDNHYIRIDCSEEFESMKLQLSVVGFRITEVIRSNSKED